MNMALLTYKGYLENGRFITKEKNLDKIPHKINVMVTLLEDHIESEDLLVAKQHEALEEFFSKINDVGDEELDENFYNEIKKARLNITRDISL